MVCEVTHFSRRLVHAVEEYGSAVLYIGSILVEVELVDKETEESFHSFKICLQATYPSALSWRSFP